MKKETTIQRSEIGEIMRTKHGLHRRLWRPIRNSDDVPVAAIFFNGTSDSLAQEDMEELEFLIEGWIDFKENPDLPDYQKPSFDLLEKMLDMKDEYKELQQEVAKEKRLMDEERKQALKTIYQLHKMLSEARLKR